MADARAQRATSGARNGAGRIQTGMHVSAYLFVVLRLKNSGKNRSENRPEERKSRRVVGILIVV